MMTTSMITVTDIMTKENCLALGPFWFIPSFFASCRGIWYFPFVISTFTLRNDTFTPLQTVLYIV